MSTAKGLDQHSQTVGSHARMSRDSMLVGVGLVALSALSAIQALVIVFIVGKSQKTDAFFIAYSIYVPVALIGVSLRRTLVPVLGSPEDGPSFQRQASELVGRITIIAILCAIVLASLALFAAGPLVPHASPAIRSTLTASLLLLAISAAAQIYAGSIAAVLNAMQLFPVSIAIYVGASALGVVVSCALIFVIGIIGAPIGLLAAALALALGHLAYLARLGITVTFRWRWALQRRQLELFGYIVAGVALGLAQQLGVVFALSAVTLGHGSATLYSYAFFITAVMLNLSSVPLSVTIMPRVIADVDRLGSEAIVNNLVLATPYVLVVLLPMLSAFAAFGKPILEAVFGGALSASNITELYRLTVCLSLVAISTSIFGVAGSMLLATRQWGLVATVALAAIVAEAAVIYPSWPAGVYAVALAHGVGASLGTVIMLVALFRRQVFAVVGKLAKVSAPAPALCIVFVIAPLVITGTPSLPVDLLLLTLSLTAYCLMAVAFWPEVSQRFVNVFARRSLFRLRSSA